MPDILIVASRSDLRDELADMAESEGFRTRDTGLISEAREALRRDAPEALLLTMNLDDGSGLELLLACKPAGIRALLLLDDQATERRFEGHDLEFVERAQVPEKAEELRDRLRRMQRELSRQARTSEEDTIPAWESMVGGSSTFERLCEQVEIVAPTDATALITGESGVGKELVARAIHNRSERVSGPFVPVNCGAIPDELVDSELFGHEKGSFTGAHKTRAGAMERANGGTLFLDEIGEMPPSLQVRLLRVLESHRVRRVGGSEWIDLDFRVLAATNRDAEVAVSEGILREDLFYRLSEFPIHVPPLRQRIEDLEPISLHYLAQLNREANPPKSIATATLDLLRAYHWPGNVRQLMNVLRRAWLVADLELRPEHLPARVRGGEGPADSPSGPTIEVSVTGPMEDAERRLILAALEHFEGNRRETARALGISLRTLYNRLKEYRSPEDQEATVQL